MTSTAALCIALLRGDKVSIMKGFNHFGITNVPREIGRSVERKFHVKVDKKPLEGSDRYGNHCRWFEYRLPKSAENKEGRVLMIAYVRGELKKKPVFKTDAHRKLYKQLDLWIETAT